MPFSFCVTGTIPQSPGYYSFHISAEVRQDASGTDVGDLVSEELHSIQPPAEQVTIKVSGLEECGSEGSGGFCL